MYTLEAGDKITLSEDFDVVEGHYTFTLKAGTPVTVLEVTGDYSEDDDPTLCIDVEYVDVELKMSNVFDASGSSDKVEKVSGIVNVDYTP